MEEFYTIQGEGIWSGVPAYFVRLGGCDVGCVWCDVKDSWDADKHPQKSVAEITQNAVSAGANMVVVTGGEPAMYDLHPLVDALHSAGLKVNIETSAAHPIRGHFDWVCISPKKFKFPLDSEMSKAHELKIIVFNTSDFEWAEQWASTVGPNCKLLLQPEWDKSDKILPAVIDYVKLHPQWRISLQTHKFIGVP
jgi:7-carboxy-7-deazaguanine synthase